MRLDIRTRDWPPVPRFQRRSVIFIVISMNPPRCSYIRLTAGVVIAIGCLALGAAFSFTQGKAYAERKAQIQVANDDAFYSLYALKALKEPQSEKWQIPLQVSLDSGAMQLSEMCLRHPQLIGNTNYNLLIQIQKYLKQHGHAPDRNPALRPVDQVMAKIAEATAKMESLHPNVQQWEEEESNGTVYEAKSK
jgi:hypothetical protein